MNKKGNLLDWFFIIAVLFMTTVSIVIALIIISKVNDSGIFSGEEEAQKAIDTTQSTILNFDNLLIFVIIGLSIFVILSSAVVFNHPGFFIAGLFLLFIAVIVAAIASNTYWSFANADTISPYSSQFSKITWLMDHLPFYVAFMGIAATVTMYVAYRRQ